MRVHGNLHDPLGSREVSECWIPNQLTEYCRCLQHPIWYESTNTTLLNQTVTGNETRVHHVTSETKMVSMIRKFRFPSKNKLQDSKLCRNIKAKGMLLVDLQSINVTINVAHHCNILAMSSCSRKRKGQPIILLNDNVTSHTV